MSLDETLVRDHIYNTLKNSFVEEYKNMQSQLDKANSLIEVFTDYHNGENKKNLQPQLLNYNEYCVALEDVVGDILDELLGDDTFSEFNKNTLQTTAIEKIDEVTSKYMNQIVKDEPGLNQDDLFIKANGKAVDEILQQKYMAMLYKVSNHILRKIIENKIPEIYNQEKGHYDSIFVKGLELTLEGEK